MRKRSRNKRRKKTKKGKKYKWDAAENEKGEDKQRKYEKLYNSPSKNLIPDKRKKQRIIKIWRRERKLASCVEAKGHWPNGSRLLGLSGPNKGHGCSR